MSEKKTEIYFKSYKNNLKKKVPTEVFWSGEFLKALKSAQVISMKNDVLEDVIYGQDNDILSFTRDRNHVKVKFNVIIDDEEGEFIFIISLSNKVINTKKDIDLTKGLCLINHSSFAKNIIYSIKGYYLETDSLFIVDKIKKYNNSSQKIMF